MFEFDLGTELTFEILFFDYFSLYDLLEYLTAMKDTLFKHIKIELFDADRFKSVLIFPQETTLLLASRII